MSRGRLDGVGVVLTRPRAAAEALGAPLAAEGARVWLLPALAIEDLQPTPALEKLLADLARFDMAIFVSANAAEKGLAAARRHGPWPARLHLAAIGAATAESLRNSGLGPVISPAERHDSEALLGLAPLQVVKGQNIVVFRGEGGREHLKESLEARGARVEYAECYRRVRPDSDPSPAQHLAAVTLVVPHVAVGTHREARRFARVTIAAHGSAGLIDALTQARVTP